MTHSFNRRLLKTLPFNREIVPEQLSEGRVYVLGGRGRRVCTYAINVSVTQQPNGCACTHSVLYCVVGCAVRQGSTSNQWPLPRVQGQVMSHNV